MQKGKKSAADFLCDAFYYKQGKTYLLTVYKMNYIIIIFLFFT